MADAEKVVFNEGELFSDTNKKDPRDLLASVVHKRKTVPAKCMKLSADCIQYEIKRLKNAKIILDNSIEMQKFWNLMHKLRKSEPAKISLDDLQEAEKRVLKFHKKLQEINIYLKKRKQYWK